MANLDEQVKMVRILEHSMRNGMLTILGLFKQIDDRIIEMWGDLETCKEELEELQKKEK